MLFAWPLVHSFSVSMGFLNFTFAFALSLVLLTVLDRQREQPTLARGLGIAALSSVVWYAHPFPLAVVGALVALHVATRATWPERVAPASRFCCRWCRPGSSRCWRRSSIWSRPSTPRPPPPLQVSLRGRSSNTSGSMSRARSPWGGMTIVPALLLPCFAWPRRRATRPFLSATAMVVLTVGLRLLARDAEQLELPQYPVGAVLVGWTCLATSNHPAAAGRHPPRRLCSLLFGRPGHRLREARPRPG